MICENCSDVNCRFRNLIGDYCNDYKPKEKQMENKLQITEEYAREIYRAGVFINPDGSMENEYVRLLKEKGYIRKSPVEEAEYIFSYYRSQMGLYDKDIRVQIEKYNEAIQYLKADNERLKKMNSDKTIIMTGGKQMKCCDNCDDSKDMCHKCDEDFSEWRQKKMITQQELTDQCTPEIIKKMVELAEGFEITERQITVGNQLLISRGIKYNINSCETTKDFSEVMVKFSLFPLLIHRAVEGCSHIIVDYESKHVEETTMCKLYNFKDYQPTTLTHAGCAMLDCLLEVLK